MCGPQWIYLLNSMLINISIIAHCGYFKTKSKTNQFGINFVANGKLDLFLWSKVPGLKGISFVVLIIFIVAYLGDGSVVDSTNNDETFSFTSGKNSVLNKWEKVTKN